MHSQVLLASSWPFSMVTQQCSARLDEVPRSQANAFLPLCFLFRDSSPTLRGKKSLSSGHAAKTPNLLGIRAHWASSLR